MASAVAFGRGFVEYARLERHLQAGEPAIASVFRLAPINGLQVLSFRDEAASRLLACGAGLLRLRRLEMLGLERVKPAAFRRLFTAPEMKNLRTLLIGLEDICKAPMSALSELGKSEALSSLTELGIARGEQPGDLRGSLLRALAGSKSFRLQRLYLCCVRFDRGLLRELLRTSAVGGLKRFHLGEAELTPDAWLELLAPDVLPDIRRLLLDNVRGLTPTFRQALEVRFRDALEVSDIPTCFPRRPTIRLND